MHQPPKIFVSFSSRDIAAARRLFYSLKSQQLDVWDYSRAGEEISLGERIREVLESRIDGCDYMIAILSVNSTDPDIGRFARDEVEYAVARGVLERGRLLPLLLAGSPLQNWTGVYEQLQERLLGELDCGNNRKYEEMIALVCRRIGWPYTPPFLDDPRLPFAGRFEREVRNMRKELPNAVFIDLMMVIQDFFQAYTAGDWVEAERLISHFRLLWRYKVQKPEPYYPKIVQGVCQLHLGRFAEAEEIFLEATHHPLRDENSYGGLGQVYVRTRRLVEAQAAFEDALAVCPPDCNWEIRFNLLGVQLESGSSDCDAGLFDGVDLEARTPDERRRILTLKAILHLHQGRPAPALETFEILIAQELNDPVSEAYYAVALERLGRIREAVERLEWAAGRFDDTNLYHRLADLYCRVGESHKALGVYEKKLCTSEHRTRQFIIEYARLLIGTDRDRTGRMVEALCRMVLSPDCFARPQTNEDYFYDGFANYLLGRFERACYDFERSSGFCRAYYDELV